MNIIGASGHGKVILDIAIKNSYNEIHFFDDNPNLIDFKGIKVSKIPTSLEGNTIIGIGNNKIRHKIASKTSANYTTLVHPSSNIAIDVKIEEGTVVMAGTSINIDTQIGKHCIINTNASIDHDCIIEDYVHISPNVALAGNVKVGEGTHIGIGASSIQGITIGKWCTIGAGTVIIKDIPDYAVVVGNPGKIIKYNYELS